MAVRGRNIFMIAAALGFAVALSACSSTSGPEPETGRETGQSRVSDNDDGGFRLPLFGGNRNDESISQAGIGVNAFLWRASLDTLNFMPLRSADPFGGVIITDWYSDAARPAERFRATVYILDTRLRADALNVSVFRQTNASGNWQDAAVSPDTELQIENAILTRARQLRLSKWRDER